MDSVVLKKKKKRGLRRKILSLALTQATETSQKEMQMLLRLSIWNGFSTFFLVNVRFNQDFSGEIRHHFVLNFSFYFIMKKAENKNITDEKGSVPLSRLASEWKIVLLPQNPILHHPGRQLGIPLMSRLMDSRSLLP